ncbi:MAG: hypothetical protein ABIN05_07050 [candidate division WOR-3 bacterium]
MENIPAKENNVEAENNSTNKLSKFERIQQMKTRRIENPRTVVIIGYGTSGIQLGKSLVSLNRYVKEINRNLMLENFVKASELHAKIKELEIRVWNQLKKILPIYSVYDSSRWFDFTQTKEEKTVLINRRNSFVIEPENDIIASILIATKILFENFDKFSKLSEMEKMQSIVELLKEIKDGIDKIVTNGKMS